MSRCPVQSLSVNSAKTNTANLFKRCRRKNWFRKESAEARLPTVGQPSAFEEKLKLCREEYRRRHTKQLSFSPALLWDESKVSREQEVMCHGKTYSNPTLVKQIVTNYKSWCSRQRMLFSCASAIFHPI